MPQNLLFFEFFLIAPASFDVECLCGVEGIKFCSFVGYFYFFLFLFKHFKFCVDFLIFVSHHGDLKFYLSNFFSEIVSLHIDHVLFGVVAFVAAASRSD
jgi:hypothetical protein